MQVPEPFWSKFGKLKLEKLKLIPKGERPPPNGVELKEIGQQSYGVPENLGESHVARSRRERGLSRGATGLQETMKRKTP